MDPCTLPALALDLKAGASGLGAFAHNAQAQVIRRNIPVIEPLPIVSDAKLQRPSAFSSVSDISQEYLDLAGAGVLDDVVQGLLGDAV